MTLWGEEKRKAYTEIAEDAEFAEEEGKREEVEELKVES